MSDTREHPEPEEPNEPEEVVAPAPKKQKRDTKKWLRLGITRKSRRQAKEDADDPSVMVQEALATKPNSRRIGEVRSGGAGGQFSKEKSNSMWNLFRRTRRTREQIIAHNASVMRTIGQMSDTESESDSEWEPGPDEMDDEDEDEDEFKNKAYVKAQEVKEEATQRVINIVDLKEGLEKMTCGECANDYADEQLHNFTAYLKELGVKVPDSALEDFKVSEHIAPPPEKLRFTKFDWGVATEVNISCKNGHGFTAERQRSSLHGKRREGSKKTMDRLSWYELNVKLVLAGLAMGVGGKEMARLLAFLDLPTASSFETNGWNKIEDEIGPVLRKVARDAMNKALDEEIRLTIEKRLRPLEMHHLLVP
jgi:hypothetical protein